MSDDVTLTGTKVLRLIPRTKPVPELILDEITRLISVEDRLHDHRRILECVEQQSPELASKLMAEHIEKGRLFLAAC